MEKTVCKRADYQKNGAMAPCGDTITDQQCLPLQRRPGARVYKLGRPLQRLRHERVPHRYAAQLDDVEQFAMIVYHKDVSPALAPSHAVVGRVDVATGGTARGGICTVKISWPYQRTKYRKLLPRKHTRHQGMPETA